MEEYLRVGVISSAHGVKGEVNVFPTTDEPEMFRKWKTLILENKGVRNEVAIKGVKNFKQMIILKFDGVDDRDAAERLRGGELWIHRSQSVPCRENENFIVDLIGLTVVTDEEVILGKCSNVLQTGANDVYVVKTENGKEILLPAIRQCILNVDLEQNTMTVHLLPGLLDIYM